ncbi:MAG: uncharacterized protein QOF51_152 [Chloroflexota bacterium]|nr:uncharacterized protein [Chloroflexota bacterium]
MPLSEILTAALYILLGLIAATYGTLIGAGGGFLLVPVLALIDPTEKASAITTLSLAVVAVNGLSGTFAYRRLRRIDYKTGLIMTAGVTPGSIIGTILTKYEPRGYFDLGFGIMMFLVALYLANPRRREAIPLEPRPGLMARQVSDSSGRVFTYAFSPMQAFIISLGVGFISALTGIGGGLVMVPAAITILHIPLLVATATSTFMLLFSSLTSTITHLILGDFDFAILVRIVLISIGVLVGAQIGPRISGRIPQWAIVRLLTVGIAFIGVRLIISGIQILTAH